MSVQWSSTLPASAGAATNTTAVLPSQGKVAPPASPVVPATVVPATQTQSAKEKDVQKAVDDLQQKVDAMGSGLRFSVDSESERVIVKVVDESTQKVLRQFPSEEVLKLAKDIDRMRGLLFNDKA